MCGPVDDINMCYAYMNSNIVGHHIHALIKVAVLVKDVDMSYNIGLRNLIYGVSIHVI